MERLKKYEIDAIMSKLKSKLSEKFENKRLEWIENFKKTNPDYETLKAAAEELKTAVDKMKSLRKELGFGGAYGVDDYINTAKHYANRKFDVSVKRPDYKQIEDDLIISTIDSDFDANKFINDVLNKY